MRILIIEDEYNLADVICDSLKKHKYQVDIRTDGEEVYYNANTKMTLKDYISKSYQTMDDSIKSITELLALDVTLKDGGTEIYRSEDYDMTLIKCNRIKTSGLNKDIYIGDYSLQIDETMCSR